MRARLVVRGVEGTNVKRIVGWISECGAHLDTIGATTKWS